MGDLDEVFDQGILRDSERLSNDNVISVGEQCESILHKLEASCLENLINAEQVNHNSIVGFIWNNWQLAQFQIFN